MRHIAITALLAAALVSPTSAQKSGGKPAGVQDNKTAAAPRDDFKREGNAKKRALKDPLEGKAPPPLSVVQWMNTKGKSLSLPDLAGKVIILKFWGVW